MPRSRLVGAHSKQIRGTNFNVVLYYRLDGGICRNISLSMSISDYWYELPDELVAQKPLDRRESSRMLVVSRQSAAFYDRQFEDLPDFIQPGDAVVLNNTRVIPARLFGVTRSGANVEIFLVREQKPLVWEVLARPGRRLKPGEQIAFSGTLSARVLEKGRDGRVLVRFESELDFDEAIQRIGRTPLPPYIRRDRNAEDTDRERYQTVYARRRGAIAAPTAGLHFSPAMITAVKERGAEIVEITLHVGYGTFEPIKSKDLRRHRVLPEYTEIEKEAAEALNQARSSGRRIIAVGTTTTRALEGNLSGRDMFAEQNGFTDLTVTPAYKFRAVDALLTNFHLPESSLLILVSTFGGRQLIMKAYEHAVVERYRFYSYGDCVLIH